MRNKKLGRKLNRDTKERKALFKSLIWSFIEEGKIKTTLAKAKSIQRLVEKLVTKAKNGSTGTLRQLESFIVKKNAIQKLTTVIAPHFKERMGGYTRIRRVGKRKGDATEKVVLEWTDEIIKETPKAKKEKIEKENKGKVKKEKIITK